MRISKGVFNAMVIIAKIFGFIFVIVIPFIMGLLFGLGTGEAVGYKSGYIQALDDARLGKPARYKLVQIAERWVEVAK